MLATSSDGKCTRVFWQVDGYTVAFWNFEVPKDPPSWFTTPFVAGVACSSGAAVDVLSYDYMSSSSTGYLKSVVGGSAVSFALPSLGVHTTNYLVTGAGFTAPYSGDWFIHPCMLASITASYAGLYGYLYDSYWGPCSITYNLGLLEKSPKYLNTVGLNSGLMSMGFIFFGSDGNKHGRLT
jgi:hypothetical protein